MKHIYGFQAGGMHPTGMLSWLLLRLFEFADIVESPGGSAAPVALPNLRNYCRHTSIGHRKQRRTDLLPPANKVCEGYVFTGVCLSTGGTCMAGEGGLHGWGVYMAGGDVHGWGGGMHGWGDVWLGRGYAWLGRGYAWMGGMCGWGACMTGGGGHG